MLPALPGVPDRIVVPCPELIVQPAGTVQLYELALATAGIEYVCGTLTQAKFAPVIAVG